MNAVHLFTVISDNHRHNGTTKYMFYCDLKGLKVSALFMVMTINQSCRAAECGKTNSKKSEKRWGECPLRH